MNRKALNNMIAKINEDATVRVRHFSPGRTGGWTEITASEFGDICDSSDPEYSEMDAVNMCGELCKYGDEERGYEFEIVE